jgi:hypothetical protein
MIAADHRPALEQLKGQEHRKGLVKIAALKNLDGPERSSYTGAQ